MFNQFILLPNNRICFDILLLR